MYVNVYESDAYRVNVYESDAYVMKPKVQESDAALSLMYMNHLYENESYAYLEKNKISMKPVPNFKFYHSDNHNMPIIAISIWSCFRSRVVSNKYKNEFTISIEL